jgi:hypothetical protein
MIQGEFGYELRRAMRMGRGGFRSGSSIGLSGDRALPLIIRLLPTDVF